MELLHNQMLYEHFFFSWLQKIETHPKSVLLSSEAWLSVKICSFTKWGKRAHSDLDWSVSHSYLKIDKIQEAWLPTGKIYSTKRKSTGMMALNEKESLPFYPQGLSCN